MLRKICSARAGAANESGSAQQANLFAADNVADGLFHALHWIPARLISRYTVERPSPSCRAASVGESPVDTSFNAAAIRSASGG